jgi:phosphoglycerate dehydrogenase-like enzyme
MPWEDIIPQCDVISLHMPLLPSTKHFIDVRAQGRRRRGQEGICVLICVFRT